LPSYTETLDAVCRRVAPHAYDPSEPAAVRKDLGPLVAARIRSCGAAAEKQFRDAIGLFGSRAAALATVLRPVPFARLSLPQQDRMLARWATSRLPLQRTVHQAMRAAILATYYAEPDAARAIGYGGPLHGREPELAWEGPAEGATRDDEPIARSAKAERLPLLTPAPRARLGVTCGHQIAGSLRLSCDVVVIGSGAGGGVAAARLAEAGHDVLVLEEGGYYAPDDFDELEGAMGDKLLADRGLRATTDLSISILQGRAVGGGTTVNWMIMLRAPDFVLDEWADDFGTDGMRPRELAPIYDRIEDEVHARLVPDDAHSANNRLLLDGARALGWRARAGKINAKGCVRSGFCTYGCRYDAKQGTLATFLPRAMRAGARLYSDVRAERIEILEKGGDFPKKRVRASVLDRATGQVRGELSIEAKAVVCAAGAIGTPALLQRSGMGGGGVGKYLRLHPTTATLGVYERDVCTYSGIPLTALCDEHLNPDGRGYGFWIECPPLHPALAAVVLGGVGGEHRRRMMALRQTGAFIALVRDGADRAMSNGSVTARKDGLVAIDYRLGPADGKNLARAIEASARLHLAAGAREVRTLHAPQVVVRSEADLRAIGRAPMGPNQLAVFSAHVNGTCRLGRDPRTAGASPDGERFGARGVYVCDGSLLPTGLGVNPQSTIMVLSTVIAKRLAARL
jgi:choline dehydrogenase-like flavoprotein